MANDIKLSVIRKTDFEYIQTISRALSSPIRLEFVRQIHEKPMTITELAKFSGLTNSTVIFHLNILQEAGIIRTQYLPSKKGEAQVCFICFQNIIFTREGGSDFSDVKQYEQELGVGMFTEADFDSYGIATENEFLDSGRVNEFENVRFQAKMIWTSGGKITYAFSNKFAKGNRVSKLIFSLELCSETTCYRNNWKSDIFFSINAKEAAHYLSPGDFGGTPGKFTPVWWPSNMTQYGNLITVTVTDEGTFINNALISKLTLSDLNLADGNKITFSVYNKKNSDYYGGFNLFGKGTGNYDQDIVMTAFYTEPTE